MVVNGVRFRHGTVTWEDAVGKENYDLPDFDEVRRGNVWVGAINETTGLVAKIGTYVVIITRYDDHEKVFDYTLIPFTKVKIDYHKRRKP